MSTYFIIMGKQQNKGRKKEQDIRSNKPIFNREKVIEETERKLKNGELEYDPNTGRIYHNTKYGKIEMDGGYCDDYSIKVFDTMKGYLEKKYGKK